MEKLSITRPDDWHLHVRNGAMLRTVIAHSAQQFGRAMIMPNLKPPVCTVAQALDYRAEIINALPENADFTPLMSLYLTASTTAEDVKAVSNSEFVKAFKLYPAGATTNSDAGVSQLSAIYPVLEALEKYDIPLLVHGEVTSAECDIFDRERIFLETQLSDIVHKFPALRIVVEHATTLEAIEFVLAQGSQVAATLTPQHLLYNRNALLVGGIKPHFYCLPILKREQHRQALVAAAISGNPKFFLGTDSAPHSQALKENHCGCAGCYSAHAAIELYAEVFAAENALDKLEGFASLYGADFYRLPRNNSSLTLTKQEWRVPDSYGEAECTVIPLRAGEILQWQVQAS